MSGWGNAFNYAPPRSSRSRAQPLFAPGIFGDRPKHTVSANLTNVTAWRSPEAQVALARRVKLSRAAESGTDDWAPLPFEPPERMCMLGPVALGGEPSPVENFYKTVARDKRVQRAVRRKEKQQREAAVSIQRITRGVQTRRRVNEYKEAVKTTAEYQAAVQMQRMQRGKAGRERAQRVRAEKEFKEQTHAAENIQKIARAKAAKKEVETMRQLKREQAAALRIQNRERQRQAELEVKRRREAKAAEERREAATRIQAIQRARRDRRRVEEVRAEAVRTDAAVKIQSIQRGKQGRQRFAAVQAQKEEDDRQAAAQKLQSLQRGRRDRKRVTKLKEEKRQDEAATRVQAIARGKRGRAAARKKRQDKEEGEAATKVQAAMRGKRGRETAKRKRQEKAEQEAATKVQAAARGRGGRKRAAAQRAERKAQNDAATKVQSIARGRKARKEVAIKRRDKRFNDQHARIKREDEAATMMQAAGRGMLGRTRAKARKQLVRARAVNGKGHTHMKYVVRVDGSLWFVRSSLHYNLVGNDNAVKPGTDASADESKESEVSVITTATHPQTGEVREIPLDTELAESFLASAAKERQFRGRFVHSESKLATAVRSVIVDEQVRTGLVRRMRRHVIKEWVRKPLTMAPKDVAFAAMRALTHDDLMALHAIKRPPTEVVGLAGAVCVACGVSATWRHFRKLLAAPQFVEALCGFNPDAASSRVVAVLQRLLQDVRVTDASARLDLPAVAALAQWVTWAYGEADAAVKRRQEAKGVSGNASSGDGGSASATSDAGEMEHYSTSAPMSASEKPTVSPDKAPAGTAAAATASAHHHSTDTPAKPTVGIKLAADTEEEKKENVRAMEEEQQRRVSISGGDPAAAMRNSVATLTEQELTVLAGMGKPSQPIAKVAAGLCVLLDVKPTWRNAQTLLSSADLKQWLIGVDVAGIPKRNLTAAMKLTTLGNMRQQVLETGIPALVVLADWIAWVAEQAKHLRQEAAAAAEAEAPAGGAGAGVAADSAHSAGN